MNPNYTNQKNKPKYTIDLGGDMIFNISTQKVKLKSVDVIKYEDSPSTKTVTLYTDSILGTIVLWEGSSYDAIGQWTDANVVTRLKEYITTGK